MNIPQEEEYESKVDDISTRPAVAPMDVAAYTFVLDHYLANCFVDANVMNDHNACVV